MRVPTTCTRLRHWLRAATLCCAVACSATQAAPALEHPELRLGFIKLTDCAPLVVAYEKGYFEEEGLYVTLEAQANWKAILDRVIEGSLDGAHMLPGQVLGANAGLGPQAPLVAPLAIGLNTLALTVSNEVWDDMRKAQPAGQPTPPISAALLKPVVDAFRRSGRRFNFGMVFPTSTHNYLLRYWLAAGGLHPGFYTAGDATGQSEAEVLLSVTPPPQMPSTLEAGTLNGFSVGEPWNQQARLKQVGMPIVTADEIWQRTPEKVLGLRADFVTAYPRTTTALLRALLRAAQWLDEDHGKHRDELATLLARADYVGAGREVIAGPLRGEYVHAGTEPALKPDSNVYFAAHATYPYYSDAVWFLTQMQRWGQLPPHPDDWYAGVAQRAYRPDLYRLAAQSLIAEGRLPAEALPAGDGYLPPTRAFIDGVTYDGHHPNAYLGQFAIGLKPAAGSSH